MRQTRRYVCHIAGSQLLPLAAFNRSTANLSVRNRSGFEHYAAGDESCGALQDIEDIGEVFMHLGLTVTAAIREHRAVARIACEGLAR